MITKIRRMVLGVENESRATRILYSEFDPSIE
jgi:hypothetical protein